MHTRSKTTKSKTTKSKTAKPRNVSMIAFVRELKKALSAPPKRMTIKRRSPKTNKPPVRKTKSVNSKKTSTKRRSPKKPRSAPKAYFPF